MLISDMALELSEQLTKLIYIEQNGVNGQYYINTPFVFGDGDQPVISLVHNGNDWLLSDLGHSLFRLGHQMNDTSKSNPINKIRLDSALSISGITNNDSVLTKPIQLDNFAAELFDFIHALLKIDELGDYSYN